MIQKTVTFEFVSVLGDRFPNIFHEVFLGSEDLPHVTLSESCVLCRGQYCVSQICFCFIIRINYAQILQPFQYLDWTSWPTKLTICHQNLRNCCVGSLAVIGRCHSLCLWSLAVIGRCHSPCLWSLAVIDRHHSLCLWYWLWLAGVTHSACDHYLWLAGLSPCLWSLAVIDRCHSPITHFCSAILTFFSADITVCANVSKSETVWHYCGFAAVFVILVNCTFVILVDNVHRHFRAHSWRLSAPR